MTDTPGLSARNLAFFCGIGYKRSTGSSITTIKNPLRTQFLSSHGHRYGKRHMQHTDIPETFYRQLCDSVDFGVLVHNGQTIIEINRACARMLGIAEEAASGMPVTRLVPGIAASSGDNGGSAAPAREIEITAENGTRTYLLIQEKNISIADAAMYLVTARDITGEKRTLAAFRDSQALYRTLAESSNDAIYIITQDGYFKYVNKNGAACVHKTAAELVGSHITELFEPAVAARQMNNIARILEKGESYYSEAPIPFAVGNLWLDTWLTPIKGPDGQYVSLLGISRDISRRKQTEASLQEAAANYRTVFNAVNDGIIMHDAVTGALLDANRKALEMYRCTFEELTYMIDGQYTEGNVTEANRRALELIHKAAEGNPQITEWQAKDSMGQPFWVEVNLRSASIAGRDVVLAAVRNIDERKQSELALRKSEESYRLLVETSPNAIVLLSQKDGHLITINQNCARMHGFASAEEMMAHDDNGLNYIAPENRDTLLNLVKESRNGEAAKSMQVDLLTRDGNVVHAEMSVTIVPSHNAILFVAEDITERLKLEEELLQAQKLESIGILAGGIAHDFNNILTAIWGNISLAKLPLDPADESFHRLTEAEKALTRAKDLTSQLLTFSRGGSPVKKTASIAELVQESTEFALRGSNISCNFDIQLPLWSARVDIGQISQVVNNLVINAKQSMPSGGMLHVSMRNAAIRERQHSKLRQGHYVRVSVRDTGVGIPDNVLPRIFDPYFTTKPTGSGLGLATSYSIVNKHDGHIEVETKSGAGSTFTFYLPAEISEPATGSHRESALHYGEGRILLMDDEAGIREVTRAQLELLGYRVDVASNGAEAVDLYRQTIQTDAPFTAVIMDLTIPGGMGGREAIAALREIDPGVKAIVFSGYFNDPVLARYEDYGFAGVISKPYQLEELSRIIADIAGQN